MGYLSSGYAFSSEPDWQRIRRLLPAFHVQGYKHKDRSLWMLDAWKTIRGVDEHFPFTGQPIEFKDVEIEGAEPDSPLATTFERICDLVAASGEYLPYERALLRVPLAIAAAAKAPTFAFTADDDTLDFAALVDSGAYVGAGVVLMIGGLAPIQIGLGAASRDYEDLVYAGFFLVAAAVAIGLRSWLMRRP